MDLSLLDIANLLIRRLKYILVSVILFLFIFFIYSRFYIAPTYTASVKMYVETDYTTTSAAINDLTYAQKVVITYITILRTNKFYQSVAEECGLNYSPGQLNGMTSIQTVNSTEIFQINVTSTDPKDSYKIVEAMQKVAPLVIKNVKPSAKIGIVDPVILPGGPSGPDVNKYTLVGAILGLFLSVLAALLWEILNDKVKSEYDLKKKYDIPILGSIPDFRSIHKKRFVFPDSLTFLKKFNNTKVPGIKVRENSKFIINEAYNSIRTNLRFTLRKDGCRKIIINSPVPNDGKSTTSANLAITLSQTGARVLLLDCDLRKGVLHQYFNIKSSPGVTDVVTGLINDKLAIQNTNFENLQVISMGSLPPNPSELLGSLQMEELFDRLDKNYDYIIIDTPPVNVVADVFNLVKMADGVVLIVKEGVTSYSNITEAVNKYKISGVSMLGFIINAVNVEHDNKSNYYYYSKKDANNG